ncbi:LysR family transcriptional regulator [Robbsia sp. KACC 23696]|uniref:LysR family transcriptional regulator n=1 Tax=Robbsia sp. KACC 23696 TaxID=3149231 RepID=UPI00325ABE1D
MALMDDLNDMLVFAEVARAGSLTAAGAVLGMPKTTVSRRLAKLEQRLGTRLLDKTTRRLELTEVGEAYLEHCLPILEDVETARDFASQLAQRPRGLLRISAPPDFSEHWLAGPLAGFSTRYPEVTLEFDLSARHVDLIGERIDIAIRAGHLTDSTLIARQLGLMTRSLYASRAYLEREGRPETPDDLARHRFVLLRGARKVHDRDTLTRGRQTAELKMRGRVEANSLTMVRELVAAGAGISVLPDAMTGEQRQRHELERVLPDWQLPSTPVYLVTPSRRFVPRKTQAFIEYITEIEPMCRAIERASLGQPVTSPENAAPRSSDPAPPYPVLDAVTDLKGAAAIAGLSCDDVGKSPFHRRTMPDFGGDALIAGASSDAETGHVRQAPQVSQAGERSVDVADVGDDLP